MSGDVQVRFCERLGVRFPRATHLIVTSRSKEVLETEVKAIIESFLRERGLNLSPEKTKITHITEGFEQRSDALPSGLYYELSVRIAANVLAEEVEPLRDMRDLGLFW